MSALSKALKAVSRGDLDNLRRLWEESEGRFDIEWRDEDGGTLLHDAVTFHHAEVCRYLVVTCGADVNARDHRFWTPLILAACNNDVDCVQVLLDVGADTSLRLMGGGRPDRTALEEARARNKLEVVEVLELFEASRMVKSALKA